MATTKPKSLEQQLAEAEKSAKQQEEKVKLIREKIQKKAEANKPKSIMDIVKTFESVLKIAKPTKEELAIIKYSGKSKRLAVARDFMILSIIAEVLNEGKLPKLKGERYYPYFDVSSGFVFNSTIYADAYANTGSASRLALISRPLAIHAGAIFLQYYKKAIS